MSDREERMRQRARKSYEGRGQKVSSSSILINLPTDVIWYAAKGGREVNAIDIIPFVVTQEWYKRLKTFDGRVTGLDIGDLDYKLEIPVHGSLGMNKKERRVCLYESFGKPCAVCQDKFAELEKGKGNWDMDKILELNPSWRCFYNIYDYEEPDSSQAHKIWEVAYKSFEETLLEQAGEDPRFFSLSNGQTLEFKGKVKPIGKNEWVEPQIPDFFNRDPYNEDILDMTLSFDKYVYIPDPQEVTELYLGMEDSDSGPDTQYNTDGTVANSRSRSRTRTRSTEDEIPPEPEPDRSRSRTRERTTTGDNECPSGHIFGKDCNNQPECARCPDKYFDVCVVRQDEFLKKEEPVRETRTRQRSEPEQGRTRTRSRPTETEQEETSGTRTRTRRTRR